MAYLSSPDNFCIQFGPRMSVLIWIQTITPIVFLKYFFEKVNLEKRSADDNKIMKNYPACKELRNMVNGNYWTRFRVNDRLNIDG